MNKYTHKYIFFHKISISDPNIDLNVKCFLLSTFEFLSHVFALYVTF